jgi:hypothetical protein
VISWIFNSTIIVPLTFTLIFFIPQLKTTLISLVIKDSITTSALTNIPTTLLPKSSFLNPIRLPILPIPGHPLMPSMSSTPSHLSAAKSGVTPTSRPSRMNHHDRCLPRLDHHHERTMITFPCTTPASRRCPRRTTHLANGTNLGGIEREDSKPQNCFWW